MKCGLEGYGCNRPDEPADRDHLSVGYEQYQEYHPECHDDPDCTSAEEHGFWDCPGCSWTAKQGGLRMSEFQRMIVVHRTFLCPSPLRGSD